MMLPFSCQYDTYADSQRKVPPSGDSPYQAHPVLRRNFRDAKQWLDVRVIHLGPYLQFVQPALSTRVSIWEPCANGVEPDYLCTLRITALDIGQTFNSDLGGHEQPRSHPPLSRLPTFRLRYHPTYTSAL